jgi:cytochrome c553
LLFKLLCFICYLFAVVVFRLYLFMPACVAHLTCSHGRKKKKEKRQESHRSTSVECHAFECASLSFSNIPMIAALPVHAAVVAVEGVKVCVCADGST